MGGKNLSFYSLFAIIVGTGGISPRLYKKPPNENIFVWDKNQANFINLFNVSLTNNYTHNIDSIRGKTVRVIADNMLPYITSSNCSQNLGGFLGDVWKVIENSLGLKSNVSSVYYDTGLQLITAGRADVLLAAVVNKKDLLNVKYSQPYFYNWYHLFIKMPEAKASSASYLRTFDEQLWFVILGIFAILTLTIWFTTKLLNSVCRMERTLSVPSCFLGIVSGFINQGFDLKLSSYSGRMQVMFALMLGVVLYSAMNAVLVAQLAVFDIPFPFKSLDDIANKRTHSLCLRSNSFVYNNFTDQNKVISPQWRGILNGPRCLDITSQANLSAILCNDGLLNLENRAVMDTILKNYVVPCKLINNQERLFETGNSFLLLKNFECGKLIGMMMQKMRATGVLQRLESVWIRRQKLVDLNAVKLPQITFNHIEGVLGMYASMIIFSLFVLLFEICYFRYAHSNEHVYVE